MAGDSQTSDARKIKAWLECSSLANSKGFLIRVNDFTLDLYKAPRHEAWSDTFCDTAVLVHRFSSIDHLLSHLTAAQPARVAKPTQEIEQQPS